jgi:hypothetical protein
VADSRLAFRSYNLVLFLFRHRNLFLGKEQGERKGGDSNNKQAEERKLFRFLLGKTISEAYGRVGWSIPDFERTGDDAYGHKSTGRKIWTDQREARRASPRMGRIKSLCRRQL